MISTVNKQQFLWIIATAVLLFGYVITWYNGIKFVNITVATSILMIGSPITTLLNLIFSSNAVNVISLAELFGIALTLIGVAIMVFFVGKLRSNLTKGYNFDKEVG